MSNHTPGRWNWHTSNSWRRLYSDQGHGKQVPVIVPFINPTDGNEDLSVSEADMALTEAAPLLLAACKAMLHASNDRRYSAKETLEAREMMEAAVAKAEGRDV